MRHFKHKNQIMKIANIECIILCLVDIVNHLELLAQENTTLKTSLKTLEDTIVLLKTDQQYIQEVVNNKVKENGRSSQ